MKKGRQSLLSLIYISLRGQGAILIRRRWPNYSGDAPEVYTHQDV